MRGGVRSSGVENFA